MFIRFEQQRRLKEPGVTFFAGGTCPQAPEGCDRMGLAMGVSGQLSLQ
jgi:hypothetical protein